MLGLVAVFLSRVLSLITKAEMVASLMTYSLARTTNLTRSVHSRIVRTSGPKGKQADRVEPIETGGLHARDTVQLCI